MSEVTVSGILDLDHLPVLFHILDHVSSREILAPDEIHTDREGFEAKFDLISCRIQIDTSDEAERAACNFAYPTDLAYGLSTHKITLSELNKELQELDCLLQLKRRLRKLWHDTRDPECRTAVN
jgi:hypothetical protein